MKKQTLTSAAREAAVALASGATPDSPAGLAVVEGFLRGIAEASGKPNDASLRRGLYQRYLAQDPRKMRYWELVSIMSGRPPMPGTTADWRFIGEAVLVHLRPETKPQTPETSK